MTVNVSSFVQPGMTARAGRAGDSVYVVIKPDGAFSSEITLYLGHTLSDDWAEAVAAQLLTLTNALADAAALLPKAIDPEPGPDDPTDEPTDEPVVCVGREFPCALPSGHIGPHAPRSGLDHDYLSAPSLFRATRRVDCLYCGHAGEHDPRSAGCPECNVERPLGSCHSVAALADAAAEAYAARLAVVTESEARALAGDR